MSLRLFKKSIMLAMRSKKRFTVFTLTYCALMFLLSASIEMMNFQFLLITLVITIFLSILYAWIIINYRRTEIATLKCIGYTNNNVRVIILGEIIWVSLFAFFVVLEALIHYSAIDYYIEPNEFFWNIDLINLVITLAIFLVAQIGGILVAYSRILKLRPIVALRIMK